MTVPDQHFVNGNPLQGPFEQHLQQAVFGLGCFWGAERFFGRRQAFSLRPPDMRVARQQNRIIRLCVPGRPAMPRSFR